MQIQIINPIILKLSYLTIITMKKENDIVLDQMRINDKYIQFQYQNARNNNKTNQLLNETFKFLDLARIYEINPNDHQNKQNMKNILNNRFIPQYQQNSQSKYTLDLTQAHPLNKLGSFGRQLQRKCRLTGKQIMQFQDGKPAKPKQIKNFKNKVQNFSDKRDPDNKIGWIADNKTYPFRIVLVDKNAGHKGIYFNSYEKAQSIRIFLTQNFIYKGNFPQVIKSLNLNHMNSLLQSFKQKLINKNKILKKSNMFSKSIVGQRSQADFKQTTPNKNLFADYQKQQPIQNTSLYYNIDNSNKETINQPAYQDYNKFSKYNNNYNMNNEFTGSVNSNERNKFNKYVPLRQLQQSYTKDFFKNWQEKARNNAKKVSSHHHSKVHFENKNIYGNNNISQSYVKSNFNNNFGQKSSKKHQPFNHYKQKDNESQIDRLGLSNINKESIIKEFNKEIHSNEELICHTIQFLTLKNLFFKPIVTLQLYRQTKLQQTIIYNTIIKKKQPFLQYELLKNQDDSLYLMANLRQYDIIIKVIDFLANQQVINDKWTMKTKKVTDKTRIISDNKLMKIQMSINNNELYEKGNQNEQNVNHNNKISLTMPDLSNEIKDKIKAYWQKQSQYQGYYNQANLSVYKILIQIQSIPLTWWKDVNQDDYDIYQIINNASKILGFKMIRSFQHIVKVFYQIYPDLQEMTEKLIAFIFFYLKPYYFPQHYNRLQRFHRLIGLEDDSEFISKINLQIITMNKIIQIQCPSLTDKLNRRNIVYGYTMMQYIYQFFSRNLSPKCLVQFWNFLSLQMDSLQMHMVLACVSLIKYYEQELLKAKRLKQFSQILQSLKVNKAQFLIKEIIALKQKYFGQSKGFLDEIKNIFNNKPLQPVLTDFFKKQTAILDKRKANKEIQKKGVMKKINKQIDIDFPEYEKKKYCLHIYFCKGPSASGSLTIRCNNVDYECLNFQKNKYFILSEVSDFVHLIFLDLKSNQYSCQLVLNQGINQFTVYLTSTKNSNQYKVTYIAGLLTDSQIDIFKRGKKFDHFVSPFVKKTQFYEQINRPIQQAMFLRKYDSGNARDDLMKRIKTLFCTGSKAFDQIEFYLQQIQTRNLTIEQSFSLARSYARQLSIQFTLSQNQIYQKHLIKIFLQKTGYIMDDYQFQCYYNDSLDYQFDAPKIIRCRCLVNTPVNKQLKLQLQVLKYFIEKSSKYVFSDIIIDDMIMSMKDYIINQIGNIYFEGELKLLYSSHGEIYSKSWLVRIKNKNKELQYQQIKEDHIDDIQEKQIGEPEVLMTEVLPSFAKISTILDYVNSNRNFDLKNRNIEKDKRKIAENINIIKDSYAKFSKIITMRYEKYPKKYNFPFFNYYYQIIKDNYPPTIKGIFLNNIKSDIKSVCVFNGSLKLSDHPKVQAFSYDHQKGLYGNLKLFAKDSKSWFFFGDKHEERSKSKNEGKVFINYGYGVFRWQHCIILGYKNRTKQTNYQRNAEKKDQQISKKHYLIQIKNEEKQVFDYELSFRCNVDSIPELMDSRYKQNANYMDDHEDTYKLGGALKYLNKFIK